MTNMAFTILGNNPERSGIEQFGMIILGDGGFFWVLFLRVGTFPSM